MQEAPLALLARLRPEVRLEVHSHGTIYACFDSYSLSMGTFGGATGRRAGELRTGVPLNQLAPGPSLDKETDLLIRRLASRGLLEFSLHRSGNGPAGSMAIEPQIAGYWPQTPELSDEDTLVLSRFAYMRRRGNEAVLESPLSGALFRVHDPR